LQNMLIRYALKNNFISNTYGKIKIRDFLN